MVGVTTHAKRRLKERCGINKSSALKMAERAYAKGISFENAGESLQRYISSIYLKHDKMCNNIRIYGKRQIKHILITEKENLPPERN